jgi:hypothetical protein
MIEQHLIGTVFEEEELEKKQNFYNLVVIQLIHIYRQKMIRATKGFMEHLQVLVNIKFKVDFKQDTKIL